MTRRRLREGALDHNHQGEQQEALSGDSEPDPTAMAYQDPGRNDSSEAEG